jgi:hypothetical protein
MQAVPEILWTKLGKFKQEFENEIMIMRRLSSHPHIICLLATYSCGTIGVFLFNRSLSLFFLVPWAVLDHERVHCME